MAYEEELETAVQAARDAAGLIGRHAGHVQQSVRDKGRHDLMTAADEAAQRLITERLLEAFPGYEVLAEEGADPDQYTEAAAGHRWIIDPIDGTTNFLHGMPPFAVSIALQHHEEVVVGVVLEVSGGQLYTAVRGEGFAVDGEPAEVTSTTSLEQSLLATGFPYRSFGHLDQYLDVLRRMLPAAQGLRLRGSAAIDLAHVACGRLDGFFETGLHPWDVAAGTLLVEEAGGRVTDYRNATNPVFARQMLASNGRVHPALLDMLSNMRDVRS